MVFCFQKFIVSWKKAAGMNRLPLDLFREQLKFLILLLLLRISLAVLRNPFSLFCILCLFIVLSRHNYFRRFRIYLRRLKQVQN